MSTASPLSSPWEKPAQVTPPSPPDNSLTVDFVGGRWALFWLALKTGFFTILTLGFYRFWMKTRLRRWYWSSIRPGGHPLEYVGDPWEKLLGFFIAVVILTFYIGIVNLLLMFVSFSVFNSSVIGYVASFMGVIPIWFYARYRARRYVLGRTRWRGVRFGLEKGAWGYAGRALLYWVFTILSLGTLWPRMTFLLEKYKTDRTYFGSGRLHQGGHWRMLYPATVPFVVCLVLSALLGGWLFWLDPLLPGGLSDLDALFDNAELVMIGRGPRLDWHAPERLWLIPLLLSGLIYGAIHYRWASKRVMANHKTSEGVTFASTLKAPRVAMIYTLGTFISYMVLVAGIILIAFMLAAFWFGNGMFYPGATSTLPRWLSFVALAVVYLAIFLLWGVLHNAFVTYPLMRHMALTTRLPAHAGIAGVSQRARDEFAEAEGFAEALDLGAAI